MKKLKGLFDQICDFENLMAAYYSARKCKRYRSEVLQFTSNLEENLISIQNDLIWKTYQVGRYREFFVHEPKKRLIMALPFRDRVTQWAIYRILNPLLERRYIKDSYACRIGFGAHRAVNRLQYWLRYLARRHERVYVLKLDVSKYFYRVNHDVLMGILDQITSDKELLWLLEVIIRSEDARFGVPIGDHEFAFDRVQGLGMPIGNLTSQMFANLYLNELDHYAKHDLRVKHYIRYMDDVVILHHDKKYLWQLKAELSDFLDGHLRLTLNNKTTVRTADQGIDFCGCRVWPTHKKLRKKTAIKMKRRLKYLQKAYSVGMVSLDEIKASVQSYLGLLKHCDSHRLRSKMLQRLVIKKSDLVSKL